MATIFDVAKYAGVSKSTVSLVINNSPLVAETTRRKVLQAIADIHYVPNSYARGLSANSTNCLGVAVMAEQTQEISYHFDQHVGLCSYNIMSGIHSALMENQYGMMMERFCSVDHPGEVPELVSKHRVDGVIIVGSPYDHGLIEKLRSMRFPFVMAGVDSFVEGVDCASADPGEGVRLGMDYLSEQGYREVLLLNCPRSFHSSYTRLDAYISSAARHQMRVRPEWVVNCEHNTGSSAYQRMKACWEAGIRPRAILAANGHLALGAMRYLYEQRIRVPEEVSVIGYEDSSLSGYAIPALTSVNIHKELMGQKAAELLIRRLKQPNAEPIQFIAPAELVIRNSVIPAAEQTLQSGIHA
ncbi:MAG: LacI family DNA-binding transcriptional regulator [Clostridia bacterium]|nr:LacI family DNA-binding transcriptional regulator [Clostridia bacterium]